MLLTQIKPISIDNYVNNIVRDYKQEAGGMESQQPYQSKRKSECSTIRNWKGATNFGAMGVMALFLVLVCVFDDFHFISSVWKRKWHDGDSLSFTIFNSISCWSSLRPSLIFDALGLCQPDGGSLCIAIFLMEMPFRKLILFLCGGVVCFIISCISLGLLIYNSTDSSADACYLSLMGMMNSYDAFHGVLCFD